MQYILKQVDFITETTPMYSDPEGNSPYKIRIESLPIVGELKLRGILVTVGQILDYMLDVFGGHLVYHKDMTVLSGYSTSFDFRVSDIGSTRYSNIGTITFNVARQFNPPTVDDNSDFFTTKKYTFKLTSFINNFLDIDGDSHSIVTIKSLPNIPSLKYQGGDISIGFTFSTLNSTELTYQLPDNYAIYDGVIYEFNKSLTSILFEAEGSGYKLISNQNGVLVFGKNGREFDTISVTGYVVDSDSLCFNFTTSDDSTAQSPSNLAEFCLIPQGDTNVKPPYVNQPPTVGNNVYSIDHAGEIFFVYSDFITNTFPPYSDVEGDLPVKLKIEMLPTGGTLLFKGVNMIVGQEISVNDIGFIKYEANETNDTEHTVEFNFRVSDSGSAQFSNIGVITINVLEKVASPPTVDDSIAPLSDNVYTFNLNEFTTNFQDPDNDSYEITRIESLPSIGTLTYNGISISIGFEFPTANSGSLVYTLPDNYVVSPTGYCEFDEPIDTIITNQAAEDFTLVNRGIGFLEFERALFKEVPNDTDIYAIFDTTSMKLTDGQAASTVLKSWHTQYKIDNPLYIGALYIIPMNFEHWVDYQDVIKIGTGVGKASNSGSITNNSANVSVDWKDIALYPPNFDHTTTNTVNTAWVAPTKILLLAFIDETENDGYHPNRNGYGLNHKDFQNFKQPYPRYLEDYKRFRDNLDTHWDFFRGVFYPIPDIESGSYNNVGNALVLQGFAAIEGGATYTLPEIEAMGVTFASERRFHWHLDISNPSYTGINPTIANPYSPQAQTPVPNTIYNVEGLKNYGWLGVYDKDQPASSVFSSNTFSNELGRFLKGDSTSTVESRLIEGICVENTNICFDFQTSDNSVLNLFSNVASVCLTPSLNGVPPTVSDNSAPLRIPNYSFTTNSFTKNFIDNDGDGYSRVTVKSLPTISGLKLLGTSAQIGDSFAVTNSNNLVFELDDRYAIYVGVVYDFTKSINTIISDYKLLGYSLSKNQDGTLTFVQDSNDGNVSVVKGVIVSKSNLCFNFTTSDNSILNLNSNVAKFCLIPEGDINIKEVKVNNPPTIGTNTLTTNYNKILPLVYKDFITDTTPKYNDEELDAPYQLKVLSLPLYGTLMLNGVTVVINDILNFGTDITTNLDTTPFIYIPDDSRTDITGVKFQFAVSDTGSKTFSE